MSHFLQKTPHPYHSPILRPKNSDKSRMNCYRWKHSANKQLFYECYFRNSVLTRSTKQFVDKILDLENSFILPEPKAIEKIIDMLCSRQGQGILRNFPHFRNIQIRNMVDYSDFLEYEDFPYVSDKWEDMFGASQ